MKLLLHPAVAAVADSLVRQPYVSQLFFGPVGTGKATLAREVARRLNCAGCDGNTCHSCVMAAAGNHPDIILVCPDEKGKIGIEAIQILHKQLSLSKYHHSGTRTVIIEDADAMTTAAQNALLKTLEEPPPNTFIILTGTDKTALLATIQSRCQSVFIAKQSMEAVAQYLIDYYQVPRETATEVSVLADGSLGQALQYARNSELLASRQNIERVIQTLMSPTLFNRLLAAGELALAKTNLSILTLVLMRQVKEARAVNASYDISRNLEAILAFRKRLAANVNPKTAYEALAMELAC